MATGQRYERLGGGRIWRRFERSTGETVAVWAPIYYSDDFLATGATTVGQGWTETETTAGITCPADVSHGVARLLTTTGTSDQVAAIQLGERFNLGVSGSTKYAQLEARIDVSAVTSTLAGHQGFFGMCGALPTLSGTGVISDANHICGFVFGDATETIADANDISITTDDAVTDGGVTDTGEDFTEGTFRIYRIDFSDLSDVRFYIDGSRVLSSSTIDMSGLATEAIACMTPTAVFFKHTTEGDSLAARMDVDYVKYWSIR